MANTQIDNYIDSLLKGDTIEFEWNHYEFIRFESDLVICNNLESFSKKDFDEDLEFWENHTFLKWCSEEEEDKQTNAWIEQAKQD